MKYTKMVITFFLSVRVGDGIFRDEGFYFSVHDLIPIFVIVGTLDVKSFDWIWERVCVL